MDLIVSIYLQGNISAMTRDFELILFIQSVHSDLNDNSISQGRSKAVTQKIRKLSLLSKLYNCFNINKISKK